MSQDILKPRIVIRVEYYAGGLIGDWVEDERFTQVVAPQPEHYQAYFIANRLRAQAELMIEGKI